MDIQDNTSHERKVSCTVMQKDLFKLVAAHVAQQAGFDLHAEGVKVRCYISESNRGSISSSIERNVRVELTRNLLPDAGPPSYDFS